MGFRQVGGTRRSRTVIFVVTMAKVYVCDSTNVDDRMTIDEMGAGPHCAVMSNKDEIVVARNEAIYFFEEGMRTHAFAFEGIKTALAWHQVTELSLVLRQD